MERITLDDAIEILTNGKSKNYAKHFRHYVKFFFKVIGKNDPRSVTIHDIDYFILTYSKNKKKRSAYKGGRAVLKLTLQYVSQVFKYYGLNDLARYCMQRNRGIKLGSPRHDYLHDDELEKVLKYVLSKKVDDETRLAILLMTIYGLRASEALALRPEDVLYDKHAIRVHGKGEKVRIMPIADNDNIVWNLLLKLSARGYDRIINIKYVTLWKRFKKILRSAGIPEERVKTLRVHDLRRTTAINLYNETRDIRMTKEFLGHSQVTTTQRYIDLGGETVEERRIAANIVSNAVYNKLSKVKKNEQ